MKSFTVSESGTAEEIEGFDLVRLIHHTSDGGLPGEGGTKGYGGQGGRGRGAVAFGLGGQPSGSRGRDGTRGAPGKEGKSGHLYIMKTVPDTHQ